MKLGTWIGKKLEALRSYDAVCEDRDQLRRDLVRLEGRFENVCKSRDQINNDKAKLEYAYLKDMDSAREWKDTAGQLQVKVDNLQAQYVAASDRYSTNLSTLQEQLRESNTRLTEHPQMQLRSFEEIERAHKCFLWLISSEGIGNRVLIPGVADGEIDPEEARNYLRRNVIPIIDTLCWIMQHRHTSVIANNLAGIEAWMQREGVVDVDVMNVEDIDISSLHNILNESGSTVLPETPPNSEQNSTDPPDDSSSDEQSDVNN